MNLKPFIDYLTALRDSLFPEMRPVIFGETAPPPQDEIVNMEATAGVDLWNAPVVTRPSALPVDTEEPIPDPRSLHERAREYKKFQSEKSTRARNRHIDSGTGRYS